MNFLEKCCEVLLVATAALAVSELEQAKESRSKKSPQSWGETPSHCQKFKHCRTKKKEFQFDTKSKLLLQPDYVTNSSSVRQNITSHNSRRNVRLGWVDCLFRECENIKQFEDDNRLSNATFGLVVSRVSPEKVAPLQHGLGRGHARRRHPAVLGHAPSGRRGSQARPQLRRGLGGGHQASEGPEHCRGRPGQPRRQPRRRHRCGTGQKEVFDKISP